MKIVIVNTCEFTLGASISVIETEKNEVVSERTLKDKTTLAETAASVARLNGVSRVFVKELPREGVKQDIEKNLAVDYASHKILVERI